MSSSRASATVRLVIVCALSVVLGASGCTGGKGGTGAGGSGGPGGSSAASVADSIVKDAAAAKTATVTDKLGAEFQHVTTEGTASVIVLPGAFPAGTKITFTPLKGGTEGVFEPGFDIAAEGGLQPKQPVFVAFEVPGELPAGAGLATYQDGAAEAAAVEAQVRSDPKGSTLIAVVDHFTVFRVDAEKNFPRRTPPDDQNQSGFKSWAIKANSSVPIPDADPWKVDWVLNANVVNPNGDITGPYEGPATITMKGTLSIPGAVSGSAKGSWSGKMKFDQLEIYAIDWDKAPTSKTAGPNPAMHLAMRGPGTFTASTKEKFKVSVKGAGGLAGGWAAPGGLGDSATLDCMLYIGVAGAAIQIPQMGYFDAVPVGVLK